MLGFSYFEIARNTRASIFLTFSTRASIFLTFSTFSRLYIVKGRGDQREKQRDSPIFGIPSYQQGRHFKSCRLSSNDDLFTNTITKPDEKVTKVILWLHPMSQWHHQYFIGEFFQRVSVSKLTRELKTVENEKKQVGFLARRTVS